MESILTGIQLCVVDHESKDFCCCLGISQQNFLGKFTSTSHDFQLSLFVLTQQFLLFYNTYIQNLLFFLLFL